MTTESWSFAVDHQNDAGFRAWVADLSARLSAIGLVQTADTGQIDTGTVSRPGTNSDGGYEIYRFDDPLQATAPIFIKFYYGTAGSANRTRIRIELGTGSDGSGAITGSWFTPINASAENGFATGVTHASFLSHSPGYLALVWGVDGATTDLPRSVFYLCRSCDANGDPDARGIWYAWGQGGNLYSTGAAENLCHNAAVNFDSAVAYHDAAASAITQSPCGLMPLQQGTTSFPSSLNDDGDITAYPCFGAFPHMFPVFGMCFVWNTDIAQFGTFDAALIGSTPRTYLNVGPSGDTSTMVRCRESYNGVVGHCILWES